MVTILAPTVLNLIRTTRNPVQWRGFSVHSSKSAMRDLNEISELCQINQNIYMQEYWKLHSLLTTSYLLQATLIWNIIFRLHHACSHPSGQFCSIQILLISGVCFFVFSFFCVSPSFFFQFMYRMPSSWNDRPICLQIFNIGVNLNNNEIIFMVMTIQFVFSINDKIYVCCIFYIFRG